MFYFCHYFFFSLFAASYTSSSFTTTTTICISGELYLALVMSTKACANIISVDASTALTLPGVVTYVDHRDIPEGGKNAFGPMVHDQPIFADKKACIP